MSAGVTARSMRRIEALRPLAALLERGAMAVMAIDEERGGGYTLPSSLQRLTFKTLGLP